VFSYLRYDSLALFLHHSNIIPESNILILEKTKGLVLAAVAQRLNCKGEITFAFNEEVKKPLNQIACFNQLNLCKNKNENIKLMELENVLANPDAINTYTQYCYFLLCVFKCFYQSFDCWGIKCEGINFEML